jgi:hypothetical protein
MKVLIIFAVGLTLASCGDTQLSELSYVPQPAPTVTPGSEPSSIRVDFEELDLSIRDTKPDDFRITKRGRVAEIEPRTYEGIDGTKVVVVRSDLTSLSARIRFEFGILQYLNDDRRARPLDFSHQTPWTAIEISHNVIQIPQFYRNRENVVDVHSQLGFGSEEEFLRFLEVEYFEKIEAISYPEQRKFYTHLLRDDRTRYEQCCPEYIKQAQEFLSRPRSDFKTLSDLGVEVFLRKLTLEINGVDRVGRKLNFAVVKKERSE